VSVIRREEKEHKLRGFLLQYLCAKSDAEGTGPLLVIARSVESPVVRAITSVAREIAEASRSVRMILASAEPEALPSGWIVSDPAAAFAHEIRLARNPRLIEAHEQLVIGRETCWIGDSMRRDPSKCDAFETFIDSCPRTTAAAVVSFQRLWSACEPVLTHTVRIPPELDTGYFEVATKH
jgi:hypothetical protein